MKMKRMCIAAVVMATLALAGCGTIAARTSGANERIYPATSIDALCIRTGGGNWENDNPSLSSQIVGWGIMTPFWILDFPFSLVSDTVMLPFDIRNNRLPTQASQDKSLCADPKH
jgi:uncharacterized protein YceK